MNNLSALFDSKGKRNYLVYGLYYPLINRLNLRLGIRNDLDKWILKIQYFLPFFNLKDTYSQLIFSNLNHLFDNQIEGFILFNTKWYKETLYIGVLKQKENLYFIKILPSSEDAENQNHQHIFVMENFSDFNLIKKCTSYKNILIYDYIPMKRKITPSDLLEENILFLSNKLLADSKLQKPVAEIISNDFYYIMRENKNICQAVKTWLMVNNISIPLIPVHGDMTPWNFFIDTEDRITLIDYESAGWNTPYYDYFHYILRPIALNKTNTAINALFQKIHYQHDKQALVLYLLDQVYQTTRRISELSYNDDAITNILENNTRWLSELLNE